MVCYIDVIGDNKNENDKEGVNEFTEFDERKRVLKEIEGCVCCIRTLSLLGTLNQTSWRLWLAVPPPLNPFVHTHFRFLLSD